MALTLQQSADGSEIQAHECERGAGIPVPSWLKQCDDRGQGKAESQPSNFWWSVQTPGRFKPEAARDAIQKLCDSGVAFDGVVA